MAATQGHTQSLHTNALDEALALPTDFSARIARNTQLFLQQESGTTRIIDPWGGSYYVERLTARPRPEGLEPHPGGRGSSAAWPRPSRPACPKLRIEEAAARTQARIDSGHQTVVGVNSFKPTDEAPIDVLKVDNAAVRAQQIDKLERLKAERDQADVARGARRPHRRGADAATATCSRSRSRPRAPRRPSARSRRAGERLRAATRPRSGRSRASTAGGRA